MAAEPLALPRDAPPLVVPTAPERTLRDTVDACADALVATAFRSGRRAGWLHWQHDAEGAPTTMRAGGAALYDGDLGTAWACAELGVALDRSDLVDLALTVAADAIPRARALPEGLLGGVHGVALAARRIEACTGTSLAGVPAPATAAPAESDLGAGAAGMLLVASHDVADALLSRLQRRAVRTDAGWCWPGGPPDPGETAPGRALTGLAHGGSGVAFAAAEVAARYPDLAGRAAEVVRQALAWERAWFDPVRSGWPDLRSDPPTWPVRWCHGAAGVGAVRLHLLGLVDDGLDLGVPTESLLAEAEVAVRACGQAIGQAVAGAGGTDRVWADGGLTLCHGIGGALDVLALAGRAWRSDAHVDAARELAAELVGLLPTEPVRWPTGARGRGAPGLFLGLAGAAWLLARVAEPTLGLPSPSLLGRR